MNTTTTVPFRNAGFREFTDKNGNSRTSFTVLLGLNKLAKKELGLLETFAGFGYAENDSATIQLDCSTSPPEVIAALLKAEEMRLERPFEVKLTLDLSNDLDIRKPERGNKWTSNKQYGRLAVVNLDGTWYRAKVANKNVIPSSDDKVWELSPYAPHTIYPRPGFWALDLTPIYRESNITIPEGWSGNVDQDTLDKVRLMQNQAWDNIRASSARRAEEALANVQDVTITPSGSTVSSNGSVAEELTEEMPF